MTWAGRTLTLEAPISLDSRAAIPAKRVGQKRVCGVRGQCRESCSAGRRRSETRRWCVSCWSPVWVGLLSKGLSDVPSQSQRASNTQDISTNQWARATGSGL